MAIVLLDAETIGQIAAGEVIERPLSVVKELVENALDADPSRISVRVRGGGIGEIEVADDGSGIAADDVPRAFLRHATSKLTQAAGLNSIATLGFRGEGLASIAAVARVTLVSRTAGAQVGTAVEAYGETIGAPQPLAGPPGTRAIVRDLFGNVPARREYLRSPSAEFARISQWLATLALAYPQIGFTLEHDGRPVFAFPPDDDLALRLAHVFGPNAHTMLPVEGTGDGRVRVRGWLSSPGDDRPDRRAQVLFVNGRLLRSTLASGAWSAAYRTFSMIGRHPYGVLYLSIPPDELDPNVHPTKSDVRLRYGDRVLATVREVMSAALRRGAIDRLERTISFAPPSGGPILPFDRLRAGSAQDDRVAAHDDALGGLFPGVEVEGGGVRVLAQVARTYILATDGAAVVLIDQHAAHERIVFEQLAANAQADVPSEPLLVPHTFEVGPDEAERLEASLSSLARGGLEIEAFGERAYRISATPARMVHAGKTRTFDVADFIACLSDEARGLDADQKVWASLACHSVVRAGEPLALAEMTTLLERLQRCVNPMHCPHGRPTIVRLDPEAVARLFKRA
jgi:DNA mismatch repair protein MutL